MSIKLKSALETINFSSTDQQAFDSFLQTIASKEFGFFEVNKRSDLLESSKAVWKKFSHKKTFVHVGIGGSSLGPEMLISALKKHNDVNFIFINNIDPEDLQDKLSGLELDQSLFYFVSKSGGTAETMAALSIIANQLKQHGVSDQELKNFFVFATDPVKSDLLTLAQKLSIDTLEVPSNVGGRFCALTPVGHLPALFAGIDIDQLCAGAEQIKPSLTDPSMEKNLLIKLAAYLFHLKKTQNISQTVFMPYSSKLRDLAFWFTQLWAESLGKKRNIHGEEVCTGMTPIPAYGATDQHSQMQLFMEGPKDKCLLLLEVENFSADFSLENSFELPAFKKLAPHSLQQLMKAELYGTIKALQVAQRPFIHLSLDKNDELCLGATLLLFESLTVLMGHYLQVNPFDQPGVEAGKIFAFEFLSQTHSLN